MRIFLLFNGIQKNADNESSSCNFFEFSAEGRIVTIPSSMTEKIMSRRIDCFRLQRRA
jgi:hypothetical protein